MLKEPRWLNYAKKLQAIAQAGLAYSKDKYDIERFEQIREISVDIMNNYTNIEHKKIEELFVNEDGYPTPKVDVRAAIFKDEKILLVKEKIDGFWSLPGGWADVDLSLKENIIKEAREEAGVEIKPKRIIAILDRKKHNNPIMPYGIYKVFIECTFLNMKFEKNIETSNAEFFREDDLPPLSTGRNTIDQINMCFRAKENEIHETIFD
ncbi:NUDIX hydrolase [Clostridium sp. D2Q-14]|uniref:NUDIX hydrolase N-terminal domain-containing protein n=1 Tax=Anaeromonas gelatinilytica TaxID=2683194 RepID=UPI00193BA278|nr:NUDIX hydrolase [Anaeromonas gelatinilytica]MBS4535340.1 NUDIX hydrolase [Anaeromonas gelatinilytica]